MIIHEISLTKGKVAIIDKEDAEMILSYGKWMFHHTGYAVKTIYKPVKKMIKIHDLILPRENGLFIDHINRDKLDNRRSNLRLVTRHVNNVNQGLRKDNKSGYKGVSWRKDCKKWIAQGYIKGKKITIGFFVTPEEAALAYDEFAVSAYGTEAVTNFLLSQ